MPLVIESGDGMGVYGKETPRPVLDAVAVVINRDFPKLKVKQGPLEFIRSADFYRFATLSALAQYMLGCDARGETVWNLAPPQANIPAPTMTYDAEHGDYHYGGDPTESKTKWSISKAASNTRVENAITAHLPRLRREAKLTGWDPWLIAVTAEVTIGRYYKKGVRGGEETDTFCVQLQVNWLENDISYHGFPDQRILRTGLGRTRNEII